MTSVKPLAASAPAHPHHDGNPHHDGHSHAHHRGPELARLLDLDAEVNAPLLEEALAVAAALVSHPDRVRRILDIGAGTGTGTVGLARRFPHATVVAVDQDEPMLERVTARAADHGLGGRVATLRTDVGAEAAPLGSADLVWTSAALHEVGDPGRALRNLFEALGPGGVLLVLELDDPPRLLPSGFADFEDRLHGVGGATPAFHHPDWTAGIEAAGFVLVEKRQLLTDRVLPADGPAGEYAALELRRVGAQAADALSESDRATLQRLTGDGPQAVGSLGQLHVRGSRTLWAARRP